MIRFTHILDFIQTKDQDQKYTPKKTKFAEIKFKLEELQNLKAKKPPCPICYEEMSCPLNVSVSVDIFFAVAASRSWRRMNVPVVASLSMEEPLEWRVA